MSIDKYDPIRVLGEGSFGKVYLMRDKVRRNFVCVKVIKIKNIPKKEREATKMEVDLLRRLHHPNIVRYIDSFLSKNNESLCICMEYCDGGDLASQVKAARKQLFSESKILHWFVQLALGLHYMHSNKVLHRDLKTQNVFLLGNGRLVLGDLGISKVLDGTMDFAQTCIGTPYYMSPEIFQNKPYSYKSDVWALGCVLYEMTTLNHAFDANSLNGLAGKIVKGRYPPIHHKYSRYLRELIAQMLMINPQQRPDLDQILRKPFIKKHIINFFTDIASRPQASVGEGTMIMRAAAGGPASGAVSNDVNMLALQKQLQSLDMTQAVSEALNPRNIESVIDNPEEAKKLVKEQAGALRREKEHKQMVEAALEKLRQERELRSRQRGGAPAPPPAPSAAAAGAPSGGGGGYAGGLARREDPQKPAAFRQPQQPPSLQGGMGRAAAVANQGAYQPLSDRERVEGARKDARDRDAAPGVWGAAAAAGRRAEGAYAAAGIGGVGGGGGGGEAAKRPSFNAAAANAAAANAAKRPSFNAAAMDDRRREQEREDKRREEVRAEARVREEARLREEAKQREEAAAKQRMDQMRAQSEAASRREQLREKERARQREEIEQLKRDKLELDRRAQERERVREDRREEERKKLEEERRRQVQVDSSKDRDRDRDRDPPPPSYESARDSARGGGAGGSDSSSRSRAEDKDSISNRDRVLQRKQEKIDREESDRVQALRAAELENRRLRALANNQKYNLYHGGADAPPPAAANQNQPVRTGAGLNRAAAGGGGGGGGGDNRGYESQQAQQASGAAGSGSGSGKSSNPMSANELAQKLNDATQGRQRYVAGGRSSPDTTRNNNAAAGIVRRGGRSDGDGEGGGYSSGTQSEDDETALWEKGSDHAEDEEEDLQKREMELKAELEMATMRCEELKRTLQATKSFVEPKLSSSRRGSGAGLGGGIVIQKPTIATVVSNDEQEYDDEEEESEDEYDEDGFNDDVAPSKGGGRPPRPDNSSNTKLSDREMSKASRDFDDAENSTTPRVNRAPPAAVKPSPYYGLQDAPSPSGRLSDRIVRLRQRCIDALGRDAFNQAYQFLRDHEERHAADGRLYEEDMEEEKISRMRSILGEGKAHYMPLIEQLIFMEETHSG